MKLYKGKKIMLMVDKDQVETCLDAGWSRTVPVEEVKAEPVEVEESNTSEEAKVVLKVMPKKTAKIKKSFKSKK